MSLVSGPAFGLKSSWDLDRDQSCRGASIRLACVGSLMGWVGQFSCRRFGSVWLADGGCDRAGDDVRVNYVGGLL